MLKRLGSGLLGWVLGWLLNWRSHLKTLAILVVMALAINAWQSRHVPVGPAPALDAPLLNALGLHDATLQTWLAQHRGQVVAVHFWATWCPICKASEDNVQRLHGSWPIVTVAMQSGTSAAVQKHLANNELPWLTAMDSDGQLARAWGVRAVPATIILNEQGQIATASMGYTTTLGLWARLWWVRLKGLVPGV
jgi:thiol-disulfide isomerase/thioredoxin